MARADGSGPLGTSLRRLVGRVDEVRDALDARFAHAYARMLAKTGDRRVLRGAANVAGQSEELILIEDALERLGLSLLERNKELRILILCMDGMSGANLAELWESIARTSFVPVSRGPRRPVLAHIPTITKLSRSALFAGRALAAGDSLESARDGDRLAQHPAVRRMGETPVVLLRADVVGVGGGLSDDAARVVRGERRIVAVVVNAIDDQLKGSAQLRVSISAENIRPFKALLDAAESTGRVVLLVSDHGNVSSQRFVGAAVRSGTKELEGVERGARHRALGSAETVSADEIELPTGALVVPKGIDRVAAAVHETLRYTSLLHAGEHGGASLAEAIAPAVLLAPRGLLAELQTLDVRPAPVEPPAFWQRAHAVPDVQLLPATPQDKRLAVAPGSTVSDTTPKKPSQSVLPFEPELAEALFKSDLFKNQLREIAEVDRAIVKDAISLLIRNGGRMTRDRFAVALKIDTAGKGVRVPGFLGRIERVLNVDQESVIGMDRKNQNITLDEHLLKAVFLEDADG